MYRFFVPGLSLQPGAVVSIEALAHQLHMVLRLQPGDQVALLDDTGRLAVAQLESLSRTHATARLLTVQEGTPEPTVSLTLFLCSLKADKFEWVLQKGTELGVGCFVPVISARSVVRPAAALLRKYGRWQAIVREAAEQSGRSRLPVLMEPVAWEAAIGQAKGTRLLPWETAHAGSPSLGTAVANAKKGAVAVAIGPEGGLTPEEVGDATAAGWQVVTLGPRILRSETAAIAAATIVMERCGELSPQTALPDS